jgi:hypothetical protein
VLLISGYELGKTQNASGDRPGKGRCRGGRTEEHGVVGLTGIINRWWRPWLKFELKFEQPGGRAWVVLEVKMMQGTGDYIDAKRESVKARD